MAVSYTHLDVYKRQPLLWAAHAVITGGFMVLLHVLHVRAFTSNLLGSLVFNLSAGEQPVSYTHQMCIRDRF